ncbi:MAG TPA: xanthine dehydrogenase family protein molybdopterin-binding subunit [Opitutaceae bacterium]|nr:xanthine dehydrogenase family protein molybdopterin-binding subunit [Opitutaceae bacterium]
MSTEAVTVLGKGINRVDGHAKVTGRANYAADNNFPRLAHAVGVFSTLASGRIKNIDTANAERSPGVLLVMSHLNVPKIYRSPNDLEANNKVGEVRPPFEDDVVYYSGQFVAVVAAETFEQARSAARLVKIDYEAKKPAISIDDGAKQNGTKLKEDTPDEKRGDPDTAFAQAPIKIDHTYTMPVEVHNPMEMHASVALWRDGKLDTYESTQWVVGQHKALAKVLGIDPEKITVHAPYIGGGFGGKLFLWPHTVVAAVVARQLQRPVKLVVERKNMFTTVGHRPANTQRVRLAAERDGTLLSIQHDTLAHTSLVHEFLESCGEHSRDAYQCANVATTHRMVPCNVGTPVSMRAPGAASGLFALESAMDELAIALKMDPIELRLHNLPQIDPDKKVPWSSNHHRECIESVRDRFGWKKRNPEPGQMREGSEFIGYGFANAIWPSNRKKASARVELTAKGGARVSCATQDIGTGTYTVAAQVVAEVTGVPVEKVEVLLGRSSYPEGPISGGSMVTATIVPVIAAAAKQATQNVIKAALQAGPFAEAKKEDLEFKQGFVVSKKSGQKIPFAEILSAAQVASVDAQVEQKPGDDAEKFTFKSFGAHCVEVRWDPGIAKLRVARIVSTFDCGRIINQKTALNQIYGSLVMGLGGALLEESVYDSRDGHVVTDNIADYHMPVNADTPDMDVTFLNYPDPHSGEFGVKGVGEIGITGIMGAIVNAIYHATGIRVRDLPVRIEKLLV